MTTIDVDIEELIGKDIAQKVLENIPKDVKEQLLEKSLNKTLTEVLKPWNVQQAIKADVNGYIIEYVQKPEIQEQVKIATREAVDELLLGITKAIVMASQERIQNTYSKLVKEENKKG